MNLIRFALRKPIAIIMVIFAIAYFSWPVIKKIKVDIFPEIESPAMYIAMPYGGLSPAYMDGFMANEFQKVLLFVNGVKELDFKSVQGLSLMKLTFYPGTDMSQASAEISMQVSRAMGFLPSGAVPPMVVRFDGSSLPVGQLVFDSDQHSVTELQTMAVTKVRPMFVNIPGITAPAPFGGNMRSLVVNIDPQKMKAHGLSPEEVTLAVTKNSMPSPAGNVRIGDKNLMAPINSISNGVDEFLQTPIKSLNGRTILIGDVATVMDAADQTVGYAIINGKRSVYLPIIKKPDASTLDAVDNLKKALPMLESLLPEGVKITYAFDQSVYISRSLSNLIFEGALGALLTGLMVFLFLRDPRGALIVILTIPIAIITAVITLHMMGQSINIMTLSGLALSIGILVDEATVTIENIHQHMELGKKKSRAILDALLEISAPKLLILLSILAVLTPAFMMEGIPRDMFMPLSMAVAFAMIASFISSQTFVPIMANWIMKTKKHHAGKYKRSFVDKVGVKYVYRLRSYFAKSKLISVLYVAVALLLVFGAVNILGTDIMPKSEGGDFQVRLRMPDGTRLERTEEAVKSMTKSIVAELPENSLKISSSFVGMHPSANPINPIFLFTSSTGEAVMQFSLDKKKLGMKTDQFKEFVRNHVKEKYPEARINFEPIELMEKIIGQGSMTPVEVKVSSAQLKNAEAFAEKIKKELANYPFLKDVQLAEPLHYPTIDIKIDRRRLAEFGLTVQEVSRNLAATTSSTRFTDKNLWVDPKSGLVFQVQVQVPENMIQTLQDLRSIPVKAGSSTPLLEDIATITANEVPAQVNRRGPNRYVSIIADIHEKDLGAANKAVNESLEKVGEAPRGTRIWKEGNLTLLEDTLAGLLSGLSIAIVVIFFMMSAYYQSVRVSLVILSVVPAVIAGSSIMIWISGSTLNLQSYMGIIMSIGVSVSNAVLLINQAEWYRKKLNLTASRSALLAAKSRFRPILMTALAMLAGMTPMALGMGDGGEQVAPLGQAVIGGLLSSTLTILLIIPLIFSLIMNKASYGSPSLDPDDSNSKFYLEK
ncbi:MULTISPECIES: efflux RND transporter permease subunit [Sphingobacterium]|uniref:efflux RND transporter permease subunit n=1 Tax=Sphingobacterium TaxID=28453 RepID=UPI0016250F3C|nr:MULTISPECIES: efflux RND transporter permease subunit [Sphingobacterium]MBV2228144.1 efflux RND transporter permease subunit [Sphingobacterium mizutaii]